MATILNVNFEIIPDTMNYDDFLIEFAPTPLESSWTTLVQSPCGEAWGSFELLQSPERTHHLLPGLWRDLHAVSADPASLRQVGGELFRALFRDNVGDIFKLSLDKVEKDKKGLRIKLIFDPLHISTDHLQALPWEYLYRPETGHFLSLSRLTPIVRFLRFLRPFKPAPITKLRVLLVASRLAGYPELKVEEECRRIQTALLPLKNVEVIRLDNPSTFSLLETLSSAEINVFHFAGNAGYDEARGEGYLALGDESNSFKLIYGGELAQWFSNIPSLRLVFLNACDTARIIGGHRPNPFRSLAASLVSDGIPAVIGMQFPVTDSAASHFSEVFYQRISAGDPVDAAVTEGRQAVNIVAPDSMEWGTPVLYSRVADGFLFESSNNADGETRSRLIVFLCHSSGDKVYVRGLYRNLSLEGYDVWLDEENILPGKAWEPEIVRALRDSHAVIVCLSNKSVTNKGFIQKEIAIALDLLQQQPEGSIYLIPAKIEDCKTPDRLSHLQVVRIDEEKGYRRLLTALQQCAKDLNLNPAVL